VEQLEPKAPLVEVRLRYREVVTASQVLLVTIGVLYLIGKWFYTADVRTFVLLPALLPYPWCCSALGRLARGFGQESWATSNSAFFFCSLELLLAWLAYGRGVRCALVADATG
jgi:hypothetical protein